MGRLTQPRRFVSICLIMSFLMAGYLRQTMSLRSLLGSHFSGKGKQSLAARTLLRQASSSTEALATQSVKVIYSPQFLDHKAPTFHVECPERLIEIEAKLKGLQGGITWAAPSGESHSERISMVLEMAKRIHTEEYINELESISQRGGGGLDFDTFVHPKSFRVALLAATAWCDAVDSVLKDSEPAFSLSRPPGHHATKTVGMGFCLMNFAVIAAKYALEAYPGKCKRVAIFDWDVHHGNGVENLVKDFPEIRYCSVHEAGNYPMTGPADFKGPLGNILNIPLAAETDWRAYRAPFEDKVVPFLEEFEPDLVIVCAGYDALSSDYMSNFELFSRDYGKMSKVLRARFGHRVMWGLEGGYDVVALPDAVHETLRPYLDPAGAETYDFDRNN